ncbi:MAG: Gfo/Idh/MocA family oxidoreductase [Kiritimatiellae bacterium]|nr:Gfo/Idh/MocA family oxidoreductase [Kiritimatiellia bacterium]
MTINRKIKVGVAGVGALGQHHARIYTELEQADMVGVYDVDPAAAQVVADRHGLRVFQSLEEFSKAVEVASVVVPTDRHREVAGYLLERGIHLLVEKPIAATTQEAEELVALAQKENCILQVGHVERFNPVMQFLEEQSGVPKFIEAHRLASYPPPREGRSPRGTEVSVVLDLMIHDLEAILHLVRSPVKEIRAVGVPVLSTTEDIANVRLAFENGCVANITASRISPERMRKIRLFYEDAYVSLDYQNQAGEMYRKTAAGIEPCEVPIEKGEPLALELGAFVEAVRRHNEPVVSGEHAAEALKLAVAVIGVIQQGGS